MEKQADKKSMSEHGPGKPATQPGEAQSRSHGSVTESAGRGSRSGLLRKGAIVLPIAIATVLGLFLAARWLHYTVTHVTTNDARVMGELIAVRSSVQGRIRLLSTQNGDRVEAGQVIAQLHDEEYRTQVEMAAAAIRAVEAEIREADALLAIEQRKAHRDIDREKAALDAARARIEALQAKRGATSARQQPKASNQGYVYYESKPFSEQEPIRGRSGTTGDTAPRLEEARAEVREIEARLQAAKAARPAPELLAAREQRVEALRARLTEAQAGLASANLKLGATTITSPIAGLLAGKAAGTEEIVTPGQTIAVVVNLDHLWIEANMEESGLRRVRPGQIANLKVDAHPGRLFTGTVVGIGTSAASELCRIPENPSTGSSTKATRPNLVRIEVSDTEHLLKPGMTASVGIDLRTGKGDAGAKFGKIESSPKPPAEAGQ